MAEPSRVAPQVVIEQLPLGALAALAGWCAREAIRAAPITEASRLAIATWIAFAEAVAENRLPAATVLPGHAPLDVHRAIEPVGSPARPTAALESCLENALRAVESVVAARASREAAGEAHRLAAARHAFLAFELAPIAAGTTRRFQELLVLRHAVAASLLAAAAREGWTDDSPVRVPA